MLRSRAIPGTLSRLGVGLLKALDQLGIRDVPAVADVAVDVVARQTGRAGAGTPAPHPRSAAASPRRRRSRRRCASGEGSAPARGPARGSGPQGSPRGPGQASTSPLRAEPHWTPAGWRPHDGPSAGPHAGPRARLKTAQAPLFWAFRPGWAGRAQSRVAAGRRRASRSELARRLQTRPTTPDQAPQQGNRTMIATRRTVLGTIVALSATLGSLAMATRRRRPSRSASCTRSRAPWRSPRRR